MKCDFCWQLFGNGAGAQSMLTKHAFGNIMTVHIASGIALTMAVYSAGGVSGECALVARVAPLLISLPVIWTGVKKICRATLLQIWLVSTRLILDLASLMSST